ncbi:MAG: hypothetical protein ACTTH5_00035 [Wolinella sp.]
MQRTRIINSLCEVLKPLAHTEIFSTPSFEARDLPIIIIKDTNDHISADSFCTISHALEVEIELITTTYKKSNELLKAVLETLKGFSGNFLKLEQNSINRENYALYDEEYILCSIGLTFYYKSEIFSA